MRKLKRIHVLHPGVRELTWCLLAGESGEYDESWANYGRDLIRDDYSRLYLLEEGAASVETDAGKALLKPGSFWLIPGGVPVRYCCTRPMRLNWVHFNVFVISGIDLLAGGTPRAMPAGEASVDRFHAMLQAVDQNQPMALATAISVLGQMVAPFFPADWGTLLPDTESLQRLRPAVDRIISQFSDDCSVDALSRCVSLHPVYFSRLFTRTLGISPARYVTQVRMRRAAIRLASSTLPVRVIGMECGYPDPYHFSRAFKRHTGVSPQGYRQARQTTQSARDRNARRW